MREHCERNENAKTTQLKNLSYGIMTIEYHSKIILIISLQVV